jgi:hypothetical protein
MKYIITNNQYELLKEYFDPIHFLKKRISKEKSQIKPEEFIKYENKFQSYVDLIFKFTNKETPLKHLKGFEVMKVTPSIEWTVLLAPKVDDWFNFCNNSDYLKKLDDFEKKFQEFAKMTAMGSPFSEEYLPKNVSYVFWNNC